jgi:hypothetical protein
MLCLPQFAAGMTAWWLEERPFFGGLKRQRVWVFWRRVSHTSHHRTQVQAWLRLAGHEPVPAVYGPSGDVTWDAAEPPHVGQEFDPVGLEQFDERTDRAIRVADRVLPRRHPAPRPAYHPSQCNPDAQSDPPS